jgi:hypothetical protein
MVAKNGIKSLISRVEIAFSRLILPPSLIDFSGDLTKSICFQASQSDLSKALCTKEVASRQEK